jgi:chromosome segregation ATPase
VHSVQSEIEALLTLEAPSGFAPDQIRQALADLEQRQEHIQRVATACSRLLSALSVVDRLHLTVRTNLGNYEQMAAAFHLWEHPASQSEIGRLQVVLRQIEHDQRSRRASLQVFQTAIETVRAGLDTSRNRLDTARLEVQQKQARASEIWNFVISIVAAVLGAGQVAGLTPREFGVFLRIGAPLLVCLAFPFLVRALWPLWKRCTDRRRKQ